MSGGRRVPPHVAVCGPGVATEEEAAWAEEVGRLLALAGA
ncbi:MAG: dethiobiotin synthetase, partial [Actinobacteria bacterium]|nr:dethiobiotin synthetase [Actinomycetota bacterium]